MIEHWIVYSVVCSVSNSLQGAFIKHLLRKIDRHLVTWSVFAFSVPFMVFFLFLSGLPQVKPLFFPALAASLIINAVAFPLYIRALQLSPLSLTIPFLAFTPLFLVLTGWFLLGELPSSSGITGILLIAAGAYVINLEKIGEGLLSPFKNICKERGSLLMLLVAALWALSASFDKVAVLSSSPRFYTTSFHVLFPFLYLLFVSPKRVSFKQTVPNFWPLLLLGALEASLSISQMHAIQTGLASYVIAIKRSGLILSIILGIVFFRERMFGIRLVGGGLMATGVFFILLR